VKRSAAVVVVRRKRERKRDQPCSSFPPEFLFLQSRPGEQVAPTRWNFIGSEVTFSGVWWKNTQVATFRAGLFT
jgi:hypothetical protein